MKRLFLVGKRQRFIAISAVLALIAVLIVVKFILPAIFLSKDEVKAMLINRGFYDQRLNPNGKGITHDYEPKTIARDFASAKVVIDHATNLMWQQSGSPGSKTYADAEKYIADLNGQRFASYNDWRLPTLEEAMSLMKPTTLNDDFYIDSKFDKTQRFIWTIDKEGVGVAWMVNFPIRIFHLISNIIAFRLPI